MTIAEKLWALGLSATRKKRRRSFYHRMIKAVSDGGYSSPQTIKNRGDYTTTLEVYTALKEGKL